MSEGKCKNSDRLIWAKTGGLGEKMVAEKMAAYRAKIVSVIQQHRAEIEALLPTGGDTVADALLDIADLAPFKSALSMLPGALDAWRGLVRRLLASGVTQVDAFVHAVLSVYDRLQQALASGMTYAAAVEMVKA